MKCNFSEKIMRNSGCNIHYWISENKSSPWLIFLHGAGTDHRLFDEQATVLYDKFNLLLWDARGHGLSRPMGRDFTVKLSVEDLTKIMNREDIDKATLIGHSMGGNIAQEMTFSHRDRVENLVLIDCTCNTMKPIPMERIIQKTASYLLSLFPWQLQIEYSARTGSVIPEIRDYLRKAYRTVGRKDFDKIFNETAACLHFEDKYTINKNILLVCGEDDNIGNIKKIASLLASREPHCKLYIIKNAKHCSNMDNPVEFNRLLIEFLNNHYSFMQ